MHDASLPDTNVSLQIAKLPACVGKHDSTSVWAAQIAAPTAWQASGTPALYAHRLPPPVLVHVDALPVDCMAHEVSTAGSWAHVDVVVLYLHEVCCSHCVLFEMAMHVIVKLSAVHTGATAAM